MENNSAAESLEAGIPSSITEIDELIDLIINQRRTTAQPLRRQGFVAFNRMAGSLATLQVQCTEGAMSRSVHCITARYSVQSKAPFGTLLAAVFEDLQAILQHNRQTFPQLIGVFTGLDPETQQELYDVCELEPIPLMLEATAAQVEKKQGAFHINALDLLLATLGDRLPRDWRIVLFLEIYGSDGDPNAVREWSEAQRLLFELLPENFGIVVAGVPQGYEIPNASHFREMSLADESAPDSFAPKTAYRFSDSPLHPDTPTSQDDLDIGDFADALARFILHTETYPPFTIGIHGPWGKGKSSFMKMIDEALVVNVFTVFDSAKPPGSRSEPNIRYQLNAYDNQIRRFRQELGEVDYEIDQLGPELRLHNAVEQRKKFSAELQRIAKKYVASVEFNAWQFQDATQIWAGLAHTVSDKLERTLPWWRRLRLRIAYAWKRRRSELVLDLLLPIAIAIATGLVIIFDDRLSFLLSKDKMDGSDPLSVLLKTLLPAGSIIFIIWILAWRILKVLQPVSERMASYMKLTDHRSQMGYQHRVMEDLRFIYKHLRDARPDCKVVVYVDDLDRCSEEKIMEILQAINLILSNCDFFVFLGMDTEMIHRAIRKHYKKDDKGEDLPENFSEHYLQKIIQISFHLPETSSEKLFEMTKHLFSEKSRSLLEARLVNQENTPKGFAEDYDSEIDIAEEDEDGLKFDMGTLERPTAIEQVMDTPDELEAFGDYQKFLKDNPREIKRLVNVHRLIKILLQQPGTQWSVERQRQLVKWLIFCSRWPSLVDDIIQKAKETPDSPDCLSLLIDDLDLPGDERTLLKEFAAGKEYLSSPICRELALAAQMSQMLKISPAPRRAVI